MIFYGKLCYLIVILNTFVFCDNRVEEHEKTITFLAKELRSLHRHVESKISNLQNEIEVQRNAKNQGSYFESKQIYKTFREMNFKILTLNVDIRQLFYEGLFLKTEMTHFVNTKTQKLTDDIKSLKRSISKLTAMLNLSEVDSIGETPPSDNRPSSGLSEIETGDDGRQSDNVDTTTPLSITTPGPLQFLDVSLGVDQRLDVFCYLNEGTANVTDSENFPNWNHNGRTIDSTEQRYNIGYSNSENVFTLSIKKLKYVDAGVLECKADPSTVLLHVNLKVKEPCNEFLCDGACIEMSRICDNKRDCRRGQDEASCELLADVTGGAVKGSGTVVVLLNKMKGWVCQSGWNKTAADVLCRSLGYSSGNVGKASNLTSNTKGFLLLNIHCTGKENTLADCMYNIAKIGSCFEIASAVCNQ